MTAMEAYTMAELRYEAPLATFDMDEWTEFLEEEEAVAEEDGEEGDEPGFEPGRSAAAAAAAGEVATDGRGDGGDDRGEDNFGDDGGMFSGSLEDLVNTFDDKIIKCFRNYAEQAEVIAPVQARSQDELMQDSQTWWTLTGNYGGILPIDWSQLYEQNKTDNQNNIEENKETKSYKSECQSDDDDDEDDDDEDDDDETDMDQDDEDEEQTSGQSIYSESQKGEEEDEEEDVEEEVKPVVTADEVISEIEGMLDGVTAAETNDEDPTNGNDQVTRQRRLEYILDNYADKGELTSLSTSGLRGLRDRLNGSIRDLSELLVEELAIRDDMDYEKELKNQFIWLLLTVQKRRREVLLEMSYRQKSRVIGNGYLTTVIPYQACQDTLSIEKLQVYIKILSAINEDHRSVPSLLTDYILKVLCPTT